MSGNSRPLSCLVAAPSGVALEPYAQILRENGVLPSVRRGAALGATSATAAIKSELRESDFLIAVVRSRHIDLSVPIELGIALALGVPSIVDADVETELPLAMNDAVVIRRPPEELGALRLAVEEVTSTIRSRKGLPVVLPSDELRSLLPHDEPSFPLAAWESEQTLLIELTRLLKQQGLRVTEGKRVGQRTADLAVWAEDLANVTGNPILIEVKATPQKRRSLLDQIQRFAAAIRDSTAPLGIRVITRAPDFLPQLLPQLPKEVLVVPAQDLIANVRALGFGTFVIHLENTRYLTESG